MNQIGAPRTKTGPGGARHTFRFEWTPSNALNKSNLTPHQRLSFGQSNANALRAKCGSLRNSHAGKLRISIEHYI